MSQNRRILALVIVLVIVLILWVVYQRGLLQQWWLRLKYTVAERKKMAQAGILPGGVPQTPMAPVQEGIVGRDGRSPSMQHCWLVNPYDRSHKNAFNRCMWA